jgi:hypothetical protein
MCLKSLQFKLLEGMQLAAEICIPPSSTMCGALVRKRVVGVGRFALFSGVANKNSGHAKYRVDCFLRKSSYLLCMIWITLCRCRLFLRNGFLSIALVLNGSSVMGPVRVVTCV